MYVYISVGCVCIHRYISVYVCIYLYVVYMYVVYLVCSVNVCSICLSVCMSSVVYMYVCMCMYCLVAPRPLLWQKRHTAHTESSARLISRASRLARMLCWNAYKTGVTAHSGHQLERVSHTTPAASASGVPTSSTIVLQSPPRDILREDICYS